MMVQGFKRHSVHLKNAGEISHVDLVRKPMQVGNKVDVLDSCSPDGASKQSGIWNVESNCASMSISKNIYSISPLDDKSSGIRRHGSTYVRSRYP